MNAPEIKHDRLSAVGKRLKLRPFMPFVVLIVIFITVGIFQSGFSSPEHIAQIFVFGSFIGIAAFGQTFVILGGGMDLSVPWIMTGAAVVLALLSPADNTASPSEWLLILLVVIACAFVGCINGIGSAILRVPPIVMTLAIGGILEGILLNFSQGSISPAAPRIAVLIAVSTIDGVPLPVIIWFAMALIAWVVLAKSTFGRKLYSIGTNSTASFLSGIPVRLIKLWTYVVSGAMAGIAGIILSGYIGTAYLDMGSPYLFSSIAAVAVGGASILGGKGSYWGTFAGALILTTITALLPLLNLSQAWVQIVYGGILLVAVWLARSIKS
ncbi:MAG: ABC transporter permease [Bacilli bacterium]